MKKDMRYWTEEEQEYLQDNYGRFTMEHLRKNIGRSESAIKNKVVQMKLGRWYANLEGVTQNEFAEALNVHHQTITNWNQNYGLPVRTKRCRKSYFKIIMIDDFWKWAENHKNMIEWDKVEKHILGAEPDWAKHARDAAIIAKNKSIKKIPWTKDDDAKLLWMLKQHKFTYNEIASELQRTHGGVKRRIRDLGIKLRPVYRDNHKKYTQEEIDYIVAMYQEGHSFQTIAEKLNRSEAGIRGKLERIGFSFNNRVLNKKMESGVDE